MFNELGGLFGWLLIFAISGTILNYFLKLVNKHYGKKISTSSNGKNIMKGLMTIFVRYHRCFGGAAAVLLMIHVFIQFSKYGFNGTGFVVALLLISQVILGAYAISKKKPRKGAWFATHRIIAVLLILGISLHLIAPYALNVQPPKGEVHNTAESVNSLELPILTLDELAKFNGEDGSKAYVAYKGTVYDITDHHKWKSGKHNGNTAGTDLTNEISKSPHGDSKFSDLEVVGTIAMS